MTPRSWAVLVLGGACALPLYAQQLGYYEGTLSGGGIVYFSVVDNDAGGVRIDSFSFSYSASCTKTADERTTSWGIGGGPDIVNGATSYSLLGNALHTEYDMTFDVTGTQASGNFNSYTAEFQTEKFNSGAQRCASGKQTFTVMLMPPGARASRQAPGAVWIQPSH